jgi:hypothetical protein
MSDIHRWKNLLFRMRSSLDMRTINVVYILDTNILMIILASSSPD